MDQQEWIQEEYLDDYWNPSKGAKVLPHVHIMDHIIDWIVALLDRKGEQFMF
jgi:hypothetical protein